MRGWLSPRKPVVLAFFYRAQRLRNAVRRSRKKLPSSLGSARDVTFIRSRGNTGDELIFAETRELLAGYNYTEVSLEALHTDRAHVMLAAAMLGKQFRYRSTSYHKVPAITEWSLADFPVKRIEEFEDHRP